MRLVYFALAWVAGLLLGALFSGILSSLLWLLLASISGGLAWAMNGRLPGRVALLLALMALGAWRYGFVTDTSALAAYNGRGGLTLEGVVQSAPDVRDDRIQLRVRTDTILLAGRAYSVDGLVLVRAPRTSDVRYGDRIAATGQLVTPPDFDTFSYADYLARSGIFSLMDNAAVQVQSGGHGWALMSWLDDLKDAARTVIHRSLPDPQSALLVGILLGDERGLDLQLSDDFATVGASHVIAISGFNMVIITGVVMATLGRVLQARWAAVVGISVLALYTLLVGANPAVVRAALMSSLLVIARLPKRRVYVPASLALMVIVMSLFDPHVLWSLSFQLSFFAVLGLITFTDPLKKLLDALLSSIAPPGSASIMLRILEEPLVVSAAAIIATLPLTILYFQYWSPLAIVVNLLIVPVQTALLVTGALATLIAFLLPELAQILYWVDLLFLSWTILIVRWFADWPLARIHFWIAPQLVWLFYILLIGGVIIGAKQPDWALRAAQRLRSRPVLHAVGAAGLAIFLLMVSIFASRPDGQLHLWLLDLGHSNAVLAQTPGGAQILVDGGRFPTRLLTSIGDRIPFYDRTIEVLAITQPDAVNIAALPDLVARYNVGVVLLNGQPNESDTYQQLLTALGDNSTLVVRAGHHIALSDGTMIEVLHPSVQPSLSDSMDASALVLRMTFGQRSFLLTSDLSAEGQTELLAGGQWPLADVMQLPRQGAARALDEEFLAAVQPQLVLLQADPASRRGDPDPDTLQILDETPLFRTDQNGTLHLWTDGTAMWVQTERASG